MLIDRIPAYPALNPLSTALLFALPATLGSAVSVWYNSAAVWCLFEVLVQRRTLSSDRPMQIVAGFFCLYALTSLTGYAVNGVGSYTIAAIPLATLVLMPFGYSILSISRKRDIAQAAVVGAMPACYVAAALALFQFYWLGMRPEGMDGNALVFAQVATLAGALCLAGLAEGFDSLGGRSLRGPLIGAAAAAALAVLLSGSRVFWVALPLNAVLVAAVSWRRRRPAFSARGILIGLVAAAAVAAAAYSPVSRRFADLMNEWNTLGGDGRYSSLEQRLTLWRLGWRLFAEHPLIGYGTPSISDLIKEARVLDREIAKRYTHFHNGFLNAAVEAGVVGLGALLGVFGTAVAVAVRTLRRQREPAERLGALMLLMLVPTTMIAGSFNIIIGHDILDATLMSWLMTGLYLASGTSLLPERRAGAGNAAR